MTTDPTNPLPETLLASLVEFAPDALLVVDTSGTIVFANRMAEELFGYASSELCGFPIERLIPERIRSLHVEHRTRFMAQPRMREMGATAIDLVAVRRDGAEFPVEIRLSPVGSGGRRLVAAAVRDVTDRRHMVRVLHAAQAEAERANVAKTRFLATASHDLRQPLHALNLFVAQLTAVRDPAERDRLVTRVDAAVEAMNGLFDALLDMSKLDAGVLVPTLREFPVQQLLERMDFTFAAAANEKGLRLRVVPSDAWVRSDFVLLERILLNLVSNAVRYTVRGGVVIGCRRRGAQLRLEVRDSGPGIPGDQQQNVFGEFYRLAQPECDRRAGLGLGLAIVDRLGRLLGHPVELASQTGKGSCFSVTIPRVAARDAPAAPPSARSLHADPVRGRTIVVIDDDALVLDGMRGLLQSWECHVVAATSSAGALARLAELGRPPDAIVSDYRLAGGESGIEAIASLRGALGAAIPAFLISGDTAPEPLRDAGASGYLLLHKPVPPMALRAVLNRLLTARDAPVGSA